MSRYVETTLEGVHEEELLTALAALQLTPTRAARAGARLMLRGCLESAGRPVDLRFEEGTLDAAEDFGFLLAPDGLVLVCGDVDRARLERSLLAPVRAHVVQRRVEDTEGVSLARTHTQADGAVVVVVAQED